MPGCFQRLNGTEKVSTILVLSVADLSAAGRSLVVVDRGRSHTGPDQ
jgi:hypothetical protein